MTSPLTLPDGIPAAAVLLDAGGTVRAVNDALAQLLGEQYQPSPGIRFSDVLRSWTGAGRVAPPGLPPQWLRGPDAAVLPAAVIPHPAGTGEQLILEAAPLRGGERTVTLRPLPADDRFTDVVLRSSDQAAMLLDPSGTVLDRNERAAQLTGAGPDVRGMRVDEALRILQHGTEFPLRTLISQAHADGRDRHLTDGLELLRQDDSRVPVELILTVPDHTAHAGVDSGAASAASASAAGAAARGRPFSLLRLRDVSEEQQVWRDVGEIHHAREISRAAVGIAHELNNGATTLMTVLGRLAAHAGEAREELRDDLLAADAALRRIRRLGLQLERFTGLEVAGPETRAERTQECSFELLQETVLDAVALAVSGTGIRTSFQVEQPLPAAAIAPSALSQAVFNVVTNAVEAMDAEGVVHIELRHDRDGKAVVVEIRDDGHGMDPRMVDRVLEPYFSTRPGGIGMGLTVTLSLLEARGGRLEIETDPGFGSTVRMRIPVTGQPGSEAGRSGRAPRSTPRVVDLRNVRVLLVEDDPLVRRSIERALSNAGMLVIAVENGDRAIEVYRSSLGTDEEFGLLMTDFSMPGRTDGVQLLRRVRELTPELPAVLSSGALHLQSATSYREAGFQYVLRKPFGEDDLRHALQVALDTN